MPMDKDKALTNGGRAARLIKEGNFSLELWGDIIETESEPVSRLATALRNALAYGKDTGVIRGIVKSGYLKARSDWDSARKGMEREIAESGDKVIKEAEEFIRRMKIRVE